jgi:hypothetical protein
VARASQKLANIKRDARVSIALGHDEPTRLCGLSMAANAEQVSELAEIDRVNELLRERYHGHAAFSPRETASALVRAEPVVISIIDLGKGPGEPHLISVVDGEVGRIAGAQKPGRAVQEVTIQAVRPERGPYRPVAPP